MRRAWTNSSAVEESRPRVELEHHISATVIELAREGRVLIPAVNQTSTGQSLRNGHSLLLTTRNTTNISISNEGLPRVTETEDGGEDVGDFLDKLIPGLITGPGMWGTSLGRKPDRFLDGQGRKMNVVLGRVLNVTTIVSSDLLWSQRIVVNLALNVVISIPLVREYLKERRASRSRATQHDWGV